MCNIASLQVSGQNFSAQGIPAQLEVLVRVDCPAVDIEVRFAATDAAPFLTAAAVAAQPLSSPPPNSPPRLVVHSFALPSGTSVACGTSLHVTVICTQDHSCRLAQDTVVACKDFQPADCPATVVLSIAPPILQTDNCVAAGSYVTTVSDPTGAGITYFWSAGPVGSPPATLAGTGPTQTIQVHDGDPQTIVTVIAMKPNCPPVAGSVLFPAGEDIACPTGFSVVIAQNTNIVAGPHTNAQGVDWNVPPLAAGTYTVRITQPAGSGETYEWFNNDGTLAATGAANDHVATVVAGQSSTVSFRIKASDCCPAMMGSATLTGAAAGTTPTPPGGTPTGPQTPVAPPRSPWCPVLKFIVALALLVALLSGIAMGCLMLLPAAAPTLIAAAAVVIAVGLLWLLICRPSLCALIGVAVWALKWAIVLGALIAIACGSLLSAFIVVLYGGIVAALIWALIGMGCRIPQMLGSP